MSREGDEVSVACSIADQRTNYRVPHMITYLLLGAVLCGFTSGMIGRWTRPLPVACSPPPTGSATPLTVL